MHTWYMTEYLALALDCAASIQSQLISEYGEQVRESKMPIVRIDLLQGRPAAMKKALIVRVTEAVVETLGVERVQVRVLINEVPPEHWAVGGVTKAASAEEQEREHHE